MSEWVTTNGYDAIYHLSDGSRLEIMEQVDATWIMTHMVGPLALATFVNADRFPLMQRAKAYWRSLGLRTVPSEEQRAAPWFKGEDHDYTVDTRGNRQFANGLSVIPPGSVKARQDADKASTAAIDAAALAQAEFLNKLMKGG